MLDKKPTQRVSPESALAPLYSAAASGWAVTFRMCLLLTARTVVPVASVAAVATGAFAVIVKLLS